MTNLNRRSWICASLFGMLSVPILRSQLNAEEEPAVTLGNSGCTSVQYSPNGKQILTASRFGPKIAQLWDLESGRELRRFQGHREGLLTAVFNSQGTMILTGSGRGGGMGRPSLDNSARTWDAATGKEIERLEGHKDVIHSAIFNRDATRILTTDHSTAILWDTNSGKELFRFHNINSWQPVRFSPDGSLAIAATGGDEFYYAQLWDSKTGQELRRCEGHTKELTIARFSPDGKYVLTGSKDATARLWETDTGKEIHKLSGHKRWVNSAEFSSDGKQVITGSEDRTAKLWDAETGTEIRSFSRVGPIGTASLNKDGSRLMTLSTSAAPRPFAILFDTKTGRQIKELPLSELYDRHYAIFSPDGKSFFATLDDVAVLYSSEAGETLREYR